MPSQGNKDCKRLLELTGVLFGPMFINPFYVSHVLLVRKGDSTHKKLLGRSYVCIVMSDGTQIGMDGCIDEVMRQVNG